MMDYLKVVPRLIHQIGGAMVYAQSEPTEGGCSVNHYRITGFDLSTNKEAQAKLNGDVSEQSILGLDIFFQSGDPKVNGRNGVLLEQLVAIAADRLRMFQRGAYPSKHNDTAIYHLEKALQAMSDYTREQNPVELTGKTMSAAALAELVKDEITGLPVVEYESFPVPGEQVISYEGWTKDISTIFTGGYVRLMAQLKQSPSERPTGQFGGDLAENATEALAHLATVFIPRLEGLPPEALVKQEGFHKYVNFICVPDGNENAYYVNGVQVKQLATLPIDIPEDVSKLPTVVLLAFQLADPKLPRSIQEGVQDLSLSPVAIEGIMTQALQSKNGQALVSISKELTFAPLLNPDFSGMFVLSDQSKIVNVNINGEDQQTAPVRFDQQLNLLELSNLETLRRAHVQDETDTLAGVVIKGVVMQIPVTEGSVYVTMAPADEIKLDTRDKKSDSRVHTTTLTFDPEPYAAFLPKSFMDAYRAIRESLPSYEIKLVFHCDMTADGATGTARFNVGGVTAMLVPGATPLNKDSQRIMALFETCQYVGAEIGILRQKHKQYSIPERWNG